ncbi:MAG: STAS domain-containing protein, partial [Actinobacteria bacterium]|nr:STAS domain-containing protein [Actinomycetota bacterium]
PIVEEGSASYLAAAALLALLVGVIHLVLGFGRLGFLVNLLSHSVLVGFTAAAAIIIGFSQVKHVLGVVVPRQEQFVDTVRAVGEQFGDIHGPTLVIGIASLVVLLAAKRVMPRLPAALLVVAGSTLAVDLLDLEAEGVAVVGDIPDSLPVFGIPDASGSLIADLVVAAVVITVVGFMESIAVAKVYARRHRYDLDPDQELIGLGAANVASGLFGGYPVTGGFSRTAVNDTAGARTPLASVVTAVLVLITIALLTPLLVSLPKAALGAVIMVAVAGLIDVGEMRHIASVKRSDLIGMGVAFVATLALGIEIGIVLAVVASMLVVFARMSRPHTAVLGRIDGTTSYRNISRFPEAVVPRDVTVLRIDASLSFVNAANVKATLIAAADAAPAAVVLDASGINDIDATGVEALRDVLTECADRGVPLHIADVKGPVRDVLHRSGLWTQLADRLHPTTHDGVEAALGRDAVVHGDQRGRGLDERALLTPSTRSNPRA